MTGDVSITAPSGEELPALLAWLDRGNREGAAGALVAEYPASLDPPVPANHRVARVDGELASHAYVRVVGHGPVVASSAPGLTFGGVPDGLLEVESTAGSTVDGLMEMARGWRDRAGRNAFCNCRG